MRASTRGAPRYPCAPATPGHERFRLGLSTTMSFPTASTSSAPAAPGAGQRDPETYLAQALTSPHLPAELKPFYEAFDRFYRNRSVHSLRPRVPLSLFVGCSRRQGPGLHWVVCHLRVLGSRERSGRGRTDIASSGIIPGAAGRTALFQSRAGTRTGSPRASVQLNPPSTELTSLVQLPSVSLPPRPTPRPRAHL